MQGLTLHRKHHAIEQGDGLTGRAVYIHPLSREAPAMRHGSAQILAAITGESLVEEAPTRLPGDAAAVARDAHHAELSERIVQRGRPVKIAEMHVIMDEEQNGGGLRRLFDRDVVYRGKTRGIAGEEAQLH